MKISFTKEMKEKVIVGLIISVVTLFLYFLLDNYTKVGSFIHNLLSILYPFIFGFCLAFLLNPIMMYFEEKVFEKWNPKGHQKRFVSVMISLVIAVVVVAFLIMLVLPATFDSIYDIISHSEEYINTYSNYIYNLFETLHLDTSLVETVVGHSSDFMNEFTGWFSEAIPALISTSYGIIKTLFDSLIGIVAAVYLLLDKEKFIGFINRVNYAFLPEKVARYNKSLVLVIRDVFYDFIIGKSIDSLIIGILCYFGLMILDIEYAALFSIIVGFTNVIPVFGPFIGAVPGIVILLIINPLNSLYFALFILGLQQFDGNILGPLILGDKLGLPSFCILFAVSLGGAFFGVAGMFVGVPVFAVIYYSVAAIINVRLSNKNINLSEE